MKLKRIDIIKILTIVLAVQIVAIVFLNLFSPQNLKSRRIARPLLEKFAADKVVSMKLEDGSSGFTLLKKGEKWFVKVGENNLPASQYKIDSYLELLTELNKGIVVSNIDDNAKLENFGLSKEQGRLLTVTLEDGKEYRLTVGNTGSQKGNSYLIYKDEKKIREVTSNISNQTATQYIKWANKIILSGITDSEVASCNVNANFSWNSDKYVVKYKDSTSDSTNFVLDGYPEGSYNPFALKTLVYGIVSMEMDEYKLDRGVVLSGEQGHIKLVLRNGKNYNLYYYSAGEAEPGRYIIKTDFTNFSYYASEEKLKNIFKELNSLLANPNPG